MQRTENVSQDSRIKRGKDEDRFYCPYPGCTRSFAELWRLKVHYRAPPDVRGSGKERGHGTELQHCPKCGKELKPGKHHVGCYASRSGARQPAKRPREPDAEEDVSRLPVAAEASSLSSRQRTRHNALPEVKFEDALPRESGFNPLSDEAAAFTGRSWLSGSDPNFRALQRDPAELDSQQKLLDPSFGLDFDWKDADSFAKFQAALPSLHQARFGLPAAPSPPAIPPDFPGLQQPVMDFARFNPDRARGKNARLPVAVTSTLHARPDTAPDDLVLQALLGDATSYAASGTSQLPVNEDQRQQVQNALAHQRIQHLAASAQERLRVQGPSFPHSASQYSGNRQPQPQSYPEPSQHDRQTLQRLAGLLQPPMHYVDTVEHYEPLGSGRPSRTSAQQSHSYQQPPSSNWIHKQVLPRQGDFRPGLTRLTPLPQSPEPSMNTRHQPESNLNLQNLLPWDPNQWGGLPADLERNVKLRQQQEQQQHQQQHPCQLQQQRYHNSVASPDASMRDLSHSEGSYAPLHSEREQASLQSRPSNFGQSLDTASGYRSQASDQAAAYHRQPADTAPGYHGQSSLFDAPHSLFQPRVSGPASAEAYGFPEPYAAVDSGSDALQAYSQRLRQEMQSQGQSQQQHRQNAFPAWANQNPFPAWANQHLVEHPVVNTLIFEDCMSHTLMFEDCMIHKDLLQEYSGGSEAVPASSGHHNDFFRHLGMRDSLPVDPLQSLPGSNSRPASPEQQNNIPSNSIPSWFSPGPSGRDLMEQLANYPKLSPFDQVQFQSPLPVTAGEARAQPMIKPEFGLPQPDKT